MFRITNNKGFQLTFPNGWTVSVQFGHGNYCENRDDRKLMLFGPNMPSCESKDAEIAAWDSEGNWHSFGADDVAGWKSPAEVLEFMNLIASKPQSVPTKPRSEFVRLDGE